MGVDVQQVAKEFDLSEETVTRESLRAFLLEQLRTFDAERQTRCAKFGVANLTEMDALLQQGKVEEDEILEDFQNVDYLTTRIERIRKMLAELCWLTWIGCVESPKQSFQPLSVLPPFYEINCV
jgi:hypothetical protein